MVFKIISAVTAGGGVTALILAGLAILLHRAFLGGTGAGWIRLASCLFLLAIFTVLFDGAYFAKKS